MPFNPNTGREVMTVTILSLAELKAELSITAKRLAEIRGSL
jgi:hypothetical protein